MLVLDTGNGGWLELLSGHKNSSQISTLSGDKHCHKYLGILKKNAFFRKWRYVISHSWYRFIIYIKRKEKHPQKKPHSVVGKLCSVLTHWREAMHQDGWLCQWFSTGGMLVFKVWRWAGEGAWNVWKLTPSTPSLRIKGRASIAIWRNQNIALED